MTYSIVARDPETGRFGVAIQTAWPMVGTDCPWVESGIGAVVTQAYANVAAESARQLLADTSHS